MKGTLLTSKHLLKQVDNIIFDLKRSLGQLVNYNYWCPFATGKLFEVENYFTNQVTEEQNVSLCWDNLEPPSKNGSERKEKYSQIMFYKK